MSDHRPSPDAAGSGVAPLVGLSASSVYPDPTAHCFEVAGRLGYDGVEVMVGIDAVSRDVDALERLRDDTGVPVLSIHAPTLLVTQGTWGDGWEKLRRSADAALRLGADLVVAHPPFRWQRAYAATFVEGIRRLTGETGVVFAVENMFPWRGPRDLAALRAYAPGWDPTDLDYDHLTLDLSHASTSRLSSLELVQAWGDRLRHVHLTDGRGSLKDQHLFPGTGDQEVADVLAELARRRYAGHVVLEVNTRGHNRDERDYALGTTLAFTRRFLAPAVAAPAAR